MHVLIVGADHRVTESLRESVLERASRSVTPTTTVVRSFDRHITVSTVANLEGALSEVKRLKPKFIFTLPSFFTDKSGIDPMAWTQLLQALVKEKYQGVLGVVRKRHLPGWSRVLLNGHQPGGVKVVRLDPKHIRGTSCTTSRAQQHNRMRLEAV